MCFNQKIEHGTCEIYLSPCMCTQLTYKLDKPRNPGVPPHQQPCYKPVKYCTFWPVLGSFNHWNIINFHMRQHLLRNLIRFITFYLTESATTCMHWRKFYKYVAINTTDMFTMVYYGIKLLPEAETLQEYTTCEVQSVYLVN